MPRKKDQTIGFRLDSNLKAALHIIARRETRSISQQVEHFIKQGIIYYSEQNRDIISIKQYLEDEQQDIKIKK